MGGNSSRPTVLGSGSQSTLARLTGDKRCEANDKLWKDVFGAGIASPLNQADPSAVHAETAKHCELMGTSPQPSTLGSTTVMVAMMMIMMLTPSLCCHHAHVYIRVFCTACNNPSTRHLNHLLHLVAARLRRVRSYTAANAILGTVNGLYICRTFIAHLVRASPEDVTLQLNPPAGAAAGAAGTTPQAASTPPIVGTAVSATTAPAAAAAATTHAAVRYSFDDFLRSLLEFVAEVEPRYVHNRPDPAHTLTRAVLRPQQGAV